MIGVHQKLDMTPDPWRPELPGRWYAYCAVAFLAPPLILATVAPEEVPHRDLVWLITLVPAYLLSYKYGLRGAVAGLVMGTVLFTAVQLLAALQLSPADWRVTVPIYVAYGAIAITVGWLSEQLHLYYDRAIEGERVAAMRQAAIAIQHEVNNALAVIHVEAELLVHGATPADATAAAAAIRVQVKRIADHVAKLSTMTRAPTTEYAMGMRMVDVASVQPSRDKA